MEHFPTKLELQDNNLLIEWSDGFASPISISKLRKSCPCATCREQQDGKDAEPPNPLAIIDPREAAPLTIDNLRPVGNYGYAVRFSDGHHTGIFRLEYLRELAVG